MLKHFTSPKYAGVIEYGGSYGGAYLLRRGLFMPWELPELLDPDLAEEGWQELETLTRLNTTWQSILSPQLRVAALEMTWYMRNQLLPDADWASMEHSLEIRTPLVDVDLLRALLPALNSSSPPNKRALAATPDRPLPIEILHRRKTGFGVPVRDWLLARRPRAGGPKPTAERGLRGWAKAVYAEQTQCAGASGTCSERGIRPTARADGVSRGA